MVAHIKRDLVAGFGASLKKMSRQIIGSLVHLLPGEHSPIVNQCGPVLRQCRSDGFKHIPIIPDHVGFPVVVCLGE